MLQRLRGMGADPRGRKRYHVLRVFASLVAAEPDAAVLTRYLEPFVEVALRARMHNKVADGPLGADTVAAAAAAAAGMGGPDATARACKQVAGDLLEALEKKLGASAVIGVYAEVQRRLVATKAEKKRALASEAVSNPRAFAMRKADKAARKKESRKRVTNKHAAVRGGKKRRGAAGCAILVEDF